MTHKAVTLTACGKPASPPFYSPWKTSEVSHRLTASTTTKLCLTPYRGSFAGMRNSRPPCRVIACARLAHSRPSMDPKSGLTE